jgi:hypothetical protein
MGAKASRDVRRLPPRPFAAPLGPLLRSSLAEAHADQPFAPTDPRLAARRVVEIADRLGVEAILYRGGLDVGGAEVDHVWAVVAERVAVPAFPLFAPAFVASVRAFVAGDLDAADLERCAHPYSVRWRVVGAFPEPCRYVGRPLWGVS